ncbi:copper/zinc binding superoxide dismutase [Backusella circina FSU 941]|nr:copper/zinc binding superoxide dismutase [Backusella circina FSU 941]
MYYYYAILLIVISTLSHCIKAGAIVHITGANDTITVSGTVTLTQTDAYTTLVANITGLAPGKHGLHIHQFGDLTNGCENTGGHFNPFTKTHGAITDVERHVGDFGNIEVNAEDTYAILRLDNNLVQLSGENSVIGRSVVIHSGQDDLGRGGTESSKVNGNSGSKIACGVIGYAST